MITFRKGEHYTGYDTGALNHEIKAQFPAGVELWGTDAGQQLSFDVVITDQLLDTSETRAAITAIVQAHGAEAQSRARIAAEKSARAYQLTKAYIQSENPLRLPSHRDANWRDFIRIVDKKRGGGALTALEAQFLGAMINTAAGETENIVYDLCASGLVWQMQCWAVYDAKAAELASAVAPSTVDEAALGFPSWIGY